MVQHGEEIEVFQGSAIEQSPGGTDQGVCKWNHHRQGLGYPDREGGRYRGG
jgi:hypothetical protein